MKTYRLEMEKEMAVVRINNFEAHNEEIMDQQIEDLAEKIQDLYPDAEMMLNIKTSATSIMNIVIYPDEKTANKGLATRNRRSNNENIKDQWHMEGELKTLYLKKRLY